MEKLRVLFVGNSHTFFNDMPTIFQMFCRENGIDAEVVMQAHPGVHLSWHLSQQWELRYGLVQGHFDYMVFQQAAHPCPPMEETLQDGSKIVELARAQGVKPIATITWCERRFPENQQKMVEIFDALREKTGICCSPVGQVYQRVEREEKDIDLYWVDGEHASLYGSYVIAACAFARITGKSPIGLPYRSICSVTMKSSPRSASCAVRPKPKPIPPKRKLSPPRPTSSRRRLSLPSMTGRSCGWIWKQTRLPVCRRSSQRKLPSMTQPIRVKKAIRTIRSHLVGTDCFFAGGICPGAQIVLQ